MGSKFKVFFEITDACNHSCIYCCKAFRGLKSRTLSFSDLDKISSIDASMFVISGGEPSLVKDKVYYFLEKNNKKQVVINTNLSRWNKNDLLFFSKNKIPLNIAIPSLNVEEFIKITGSSSRDFENIKSNLEYVSTDSKIIIIVNKHNYYNLEETVNRFALLGFYNILIQPSYGFDNPESWADSIYNTYRRHRNLNIRTFSYVDERLPYSHKCDAGTGRVVILIDKKIVPCACQMLSPIGDLDNLDVAKMEKLGRLFFDKSHNVVGEKCRGYTCLSEM